MLCPEELQTGIEFIDDEHAGLARTMDLLDDAVDAREADPSSLDVELLLERLWAQITVHFAHEEEAMRDHGYPWAGQHLAQHAQFLRTLASMRRDAAEGDPAATTGWMIRYVRTWFVQHTLEADGPFARWLASSPS